MSLAGTLDNTSETSGEVCFIVDLDGDSRLVVLRTQDAHENDILHAAPQCKTISHIL
jgi:hypothetical protein